MICRVLPYLILFYSIITTLSSPYLSILEIYYIAFKNLMHDIYGIFPLYMRSNKFIALHFLNSSTAATLCIIQINFLVILRSEMH